VRRGDEANSSRVEIFAKQLFLAAEQLFVGQRSMKPKAMERRGASSLSGLHGNIWCICPSAWVTLSPFQETLFNVVETFDALDFGEKERAFPQVTRVALSIIGIILK
jgi:hypothetical protein